MIMCNICLSRGRNLSKLSTEQRRVFDTLLPQLTFDQRESSKESVCWECVALLEKVLCFQRQAACAQSWLQWAHAQSDFEVFNEVKSLSSLSSSINTKCILVLSSQWGTSNHPDDSNVDTQIQTASLRDDNFIEIVPVFNSFIDNEFDSIKTEKIEENAQCKDLMPYIAKTKTDIRELSIKAHKHKKKSKKNRDNVRKKKESKYKNSGICKSVVNEGEQDFKENGCWFEDTALGTIRPSYECNNCKKIFTSRLRMENHYKRFFGNCMKKQNIRKQRVKSIFECPDCGLKFTYRCNLVEHSRTHTGEKPHVCKQCGKRYTQTASLNRHMRTHSEDRRFVCTDCGQRFVERRTLTDHYNIHTGLRPYLCSECGKSFTQKGALRTHCKTHCGGKGVLGRMEIRE